MPFTYTFFNGNVVVACVGDIMGTLTIFVVLVYGNQKLLNRQIFFFNL